jgi:hypothetical protein
LSNELYKDDDGTIYLAWRLFQTDDFTWVNSEDWDTRCSHLHDVGCKYKQMIKVNLTEDLLKFKRILITKDNETLCNDIPEKYLEVVDISGHWINNLFYRMLRDADCPKTPKYIQYLYRAGVSLNINWFKKKKKGIELPRIYDEDWNND